jgi:hypothetical protein
MTLTAEFNSKAQIKRRAGVETETIGGQSLSLYFCSIAIRKRGAQPEPVFLKPVIIAAPVLIRRGMNI